MTAAVQPLGRMISLDKITLHPDLQARTRIKEETVKEYAANFKSGVEMDSIHLFTSATQEGPYYLADGNHRFFAAVSVELKKLPAIVHEIDGDEAAVLKAALQFGIEKNAGHGLNFSIEDKRRAVYLLIKSDRKLSNKAVALMCRVSPDFVAKIREKGPEKQAPKKRAAKEQPTTVLQPSKPAPSAPTPGTPEEAAAQNNPTLERVRTLKTWKQDGSLDFPEIREVYRTKTAIPTMLPTAPDHMMVVHGDVKLAVPIAGITVKSGVVEVLVDKEAFMSHLREWIPQEVKE